MFSRYVLEILILKALENNGYSRDSSKKIGAKREVYLHNRL